MSDSSGEKTEEPTQKKIDDSRKKGQVWKSKDLTGVFVFMVGLGTVKVFWGTIEEEFKNLFAFTFDRLAHGGGSFASIYESLVLALRAVLFCSLPVLVACAVIGGVSDFLQVGALMSTESLMPKLEKLNPIEGAKNLFSKKQLVELLKSSLKMLLAGYVVYAAVRNSLAVVVGSTRASTAGLMHVIGELIHLIVVRVGLLFVVFAIFDVWWQRRVYMKDLMMTKDEVKREYKESEGDPHHKAKRKELHMEILEGAQMESVKKADVIVTNPDHVAVALRYDSGLDGAPRVLAHATDEAAQALKAYAREHGVSILRNVPLAHALLKVDPGDEIPESLHEGVAEVLVMVQTLVELTGAPVAEEDVPMVTAGPERRA